jgi:3-phenylpropionate/cinnamic acid dioxygenase small subunit
MPPMTLEEISDRIEIQDLLTRYTVAIDEKDWEKLDTCFLSDAKVDYTTSGGIKGVYPDVRAWLEKALAPFTMTQHLISNTTVTIEGDRATSRTYVYNPMGIPKKDGSLHIFTVGAYYDDKLVRTSEGWRIAERFEEQAFMEGSLPGDFEIPS